MRALFTRALTIAGTLLCAAATVYAQPQGLERVGPIQAANGFPAWYQDKTGLTLEFCQPLNQAELDAGWCLLLPGDTVVPEQFPALFAAEHFWFAASATTAGQPVDALLVIGLEGAFAGGPPVPGDQLVFSRIRIRFIAPAAGTYTVYHPYGVETVQAAAAGDRVFFTRDVGIGCPGSFDCALRGDIGPFLLASPTPGGPELPAVVGPVPGKLYIAAPDRLGPVTGSPVGQNYFRIVGPGGTVLAETSAFSLVGRVFQGTMPGRLTVDRASYSRAAGVATGKIDVFATASPTAPSRLPGSAPTGVVTPVLDFFAAPCAAAPDGTIIGEPAGVSPNQMVGDGSRFYGQIQDGPIAAAVCVRDSTARDVNGQVVPLFKQAQLSDVVKITAAQFDPNAGTLSVQAESSDLNAPPALTALLVGPLTGGSASVAMTAPPSLVQVTSSLGGTANAPVTTVAGPLQPSNRPFAGNDAASVNEDSGVNQILVLANDTINGNPITPADAPVITLVGQARLGTAAVNPGGWIDYAPAPNLFGSDLISYTVTVGTATSSAAFVTITVVNVNDPPVAVADSADGTAGTSLTINLFANDTDPDGAADLRTATIVSVPADPGVIWSVAGGVLTLTGPAGTHTFTYYASDAAGAQSNTVSVTVTLVSTEDLAITRADFIQNKRRWRVDGTTNVLTTHNVFISYADGTFADGRPAAGTLVGTAQAIAGLFTLDLTLAGANDPRNPVGPLFSQPPTRVFASTPGGVSPTFTIALR